MDLLKTSSDLRIIAAELAWMAKSDTKCCGISQAQLPLLDFIGRKGPVTLSDIAEVFPTDVSGLSRTVQGLVKSGLVTRSENSLDRRKTELLLTKKGSHLHCAITTNACQFVETLLKDLQAAQKKTMIQGISALAHLLSSGRKNECCVPFLAKQGAN